MDPTLDTFTQIGDVISSFSGGVYLGVAAACFFLVQLIKGKFKVKIPYVTAWLEGRGAAAKTYILWGLYAIAGGVLSLGAEHVTFWSVVNGIIAGLAVGLGATGAHTGVKQSIDAVKNWKKDQP